MIILIMIIVIVLVIHGIRESPSFRVIRTKVLGQELFPDRQKKVRGRVALAQLLHLGLSRCRHFVYWLCCYGYPRTAAFS